MAYLMNIGFDNSLRLCRNVYYFEYKGIKYKLIQNNRLKWCDVLLTIITGAYNKKKNDDAYVVASEFLSALSWQNGSMIKLRHSGGGGVPDNYKLRNAKPVIRDFPKIPFIGHHTGYDICTIPKIETEEQRTALILLREASSSNNEYLSFLFFWQVLETEKGHASEWIDETYKNNHNKINLYKADIDNISLKGKSLGHYLYDDCRNTIAHIMRKGGGKRRLELDTPEENVRISRCTNIIRAFALFYIENKLKLQKKMYLVRKNGRGFPTFVDEGDANIFYTIAYKRS
jgi:hypothetical protein